MIIIRLSGGIGNQLFQYAFGRTLSIKNATTLKADISDFNNPKNPRTYKLDAYNTVMEIAALDDFKSIGIPDPTAQEIARRVIRRIYRAKEHFVPLPKRKLILEPSFQFHPELLNASQNCYLSGVWQSEKYFAPIADVLRKEITLKNTPTPQTESWIQKMRTCNSVSLHIRRGDYVANQKTHAFHGVCSPRYYQDAVRFISQKIPHPTFFIFSDDIDWVKEHFRIAQPAMYVSDGTIPDYEELVIMSNCKHHIIANSSFSWWGAWLNPHTEKIVVTPKKWFASESVPTQDLIPDTWITI